MDNLKKLLEEKKYELVLSITETVKDSTNLFYRLSALVALGKINDAIYLIENNQKELEKELPVLMHYHIELLCLNSEFDKAYEKIKYYENLPYFSQEAEEILRQLPKTVREYENAKSKFVKDEEDLLKGLLSNEDDVVLASLDSLKSLALEPYYLAIQKILVNYPKQAIRSFALLLLVQRVVNLDFEFNHMGKIIKVKPSELKPPFVGDTYDNFVSQIQSKYKNPSITNNAVSILSSYLIYTYPDNIEFDDCLINALYYLSCSYLNETLPQIDEHESKLVDKIENCLKDF